MLSVDDLNEEVLSFMKLAYTEESEQH
jgi:hypothetical protein